MKKSTNVTKDFYVSINGKVVTSIQSFGYGDNSYDHINRKEYDTETEAIEVYKRLGGR